VLNKLIHSRVQTVNAYAMVTNGSCADYTIIRLNAPVELSTHYTTADIVLEVGSTSASLISIQLDRCSAKNCTVSEI